MCLSIASLNSGSNGNCYYIGNEHEAVLVDAGISCRETEKRMGRLGLSPHKLKAIFISHEHTDHISGAVQISRKYQLPVFITAITLQHSRLNIDPYLVRGFRAFQPVSIGGLSVHAFPKQHDAADPHSFIITGNGVNIGVFTDIGVACPHVSGHFNQCHAAFLEANYDENMLHQGRYPPHLKKRISGDKGHLSNRQALELFRMHKHSGMSHILLSHLSKDNNRPELACHLFEEHAGKTKIIVASRYGESGVYTIVNKGTGKLTGARKTMEGKAVQMALF
jgi:phosphoribosyl 1,2-cyclic phosphodiesterase